jgi:hypothetical protein
MGGGRVLTVQVKMVKRHFSEFIGEVSNWQFFAFRRLAGKERSGF